MRKLAKTVTLSVEALRHVEALAGARDISFSAWVDELIRVHREANCERCDLAAPCSGDDAENVIQGEFWRGE